MPSKKEAALVSLTVRRALKLLDKEIAAAHEFLAGVEGRRLDLLIPSLVIMLERYHEQNKDKQYPGGLGRFDVAKNYTDAGFTMDFRFAEKLLIYAEKEKKAYILYESTQENDDIYGSQEAYKKAYPDQEKI